jgi:acetoin utilization deacetylase AcuC-like enzyme
VRTFIMPFDGVVIREALQRERFRGGQVFCVVPRLEDLDRMAARLREVAKVSAKGRVGLFLEGGYDLGALERSVEAAVLGLVAPSPRKHPRARDEASTEASLYRVVAAQRPFWKGL